MSLDEHVPDFVANVKGIKTGKQFIKLKLKRPLYLRNGEGGESTFEQMSAITRADAGRIIPRNATYKNSLVSLKLIVFYCGPFELKTGFHSQKDITDQGRRVMI